MIIGGRGRSYEAGSVLLDSEVSDTVWKVGTAAVVILRTVDVVRLVDVCGGVEVVGRMLVEALVENTPTLVVEDALPKVGEDIVVEDVPNGVIVEILPGFEDGVTSRIVENIPAGVVEDILSGAIVDISTEIVEGISVGVVEIV